jgi:Protein of unknown function (DUF3995)
MSGGRGRMRGRSGRPAAAVIGAGALGALGLLHLSWAAGSAWPARDRGALADVMAGRREPPSASACVLVGTGLTGAAALVAGAGGRSRPARLARIALATGFLARGVAGVTGNTRLMVPWTPNERFVRLDRRYYGPLCLGIATCAALSARRRRG